MRELLLSTSAVRVYPPIPDNGPGPSTLRKFDEVSGDGYFGQTTTAELFTVEEVETKAKTTLIGTPQNRSVLDLWGKYIINGKILYIPKVTVRTGVSWANLYSAGFMYGTDNNGTYPFTTNANFDVVPLTPVNQLTTIQKTSSDGSVWTFKIRCVSTMPTDPGPNFNVAATVAQSEYSRTIERTAPSVGIPTPWAVNGRPNNVVVGKESWNSGSGLQVYFISANGNSNAYTRAQATKNNVGAGWLPVLEIVSVVRP